MKNEEGIAGLLFQRVLNNFKPKSDVCSRKIDVGRSP